MTFELRLEDQEKLAGVDGLGWGEHEINRQTGVGGACAPPCRESGLAVRATGQRLDQGESGWRGGRWQGSRASPHKTPCPHQARGVLFLVSSERHGVWRGLSMERVLTLREMEATGSF